MNENPEQSQKTEEPSQKKLEKAYEEGNVFTSKEVTSFLSILTLALCTIFLGDIFCTNLLRTVIPYITSPYQILTILNRNSGHMLDITQLFQQVLVSIWPFILGPALIMMLVSICSLLLQHGIIYSPNVIQPKLERISPIAGFKRIFSLNSVIELLKGLVKIILVGILMYIAIKGELQSFSQSYQLSILGGMKLLMKGVFKLFIGVCCFMFVLAIVDYLYQRHAYMNKMKMTKQEVKDEHKQQEGHAEIKSKLRSMRAQMSKRRIRAALPNADVLITNPTHYAIALEYKPEKMDVPVVIAKGQDNIALMMREVAAEYKIPIIENAPLARALYADVKEKEKIQYKHYKAVADVISFIMKVQKKH